MRRRPDWAVRLAALLSAVEARAFDAHRWNCGRFALAAIEAVMGERPAFRVLPELAATADSAGFPRVPPLLARMTDQFEQAIAGFYESCAAFRPRTRPGWHDPVTSPVPALVFSGLSDTQTAASWGPETARHLPNGRAVVFPETGHGALAFSACARDLGVAFIENPSAPLDTRCVADLRPRFVLPDGSEAR